MNKLLCIADLWWSWMISSTWQIALLSLLIWFVSLLFSRSSARFRYLLWLLVFVKLLVPPGISAPWPLPSWCAALPVQVNFGWDREQAAQVMLAQPAETFSESAPAMAQARGPGLQTAPHSIPLSAAAFGVWALVSTVLFTFLLAQWRIYTRRILSTLEEPPAALAEIFKSQKCACGVRGATLSISSAVSTPGVFGAFRPRVLLPQDWESRFSAEELSAIMAHELAHVQRHDIPVAWVTTMLTCLYWHHPFVWIAHFRLRREREMACDDCALTRLHQKETDYASTILRVAELFDGRVPAGAGLMGLLEISDNLLHRIRSIGDVRRPRQMGWTCTSILIVLILLMPMGARPAQAGNTNLASDGVSITAPATTQTAPTATNPAAPPFAAAVQATTAAAEDEPAPVAVGAAVLEFSRIGGAERLGDAAAQLRVLVVERLAETAGVRLVEREKVDSILSELHLNASGLIAGPTAARIGALTGAQKLITAKLMAMDEEWVVTANIIDTQTSEIRAVRVTGKEVAGLLPLADATARAIGEKFAGAATKNTGAKVDSLEMEIAAIRIALAGKRLPRVLVSVPESHLGTIVPDPAGQTEIMKVLSRVGYTVVDVSTFLKTEPGSWWMNIFYRESPDQNGRELTFSEGGRSAAEILHDKRIDKIKEKADVFILGEAFSEYAGENHGFKTCRARVEVKALDTDKEVVAAAVSEHATAADVAEMIAGKSALRDAGGQAGLTLARQLAGYWEGR